MTISEHLGKKRSGRFGTLTQGDNKFKLLFRPDVSEYGTYSVIVSSDEGSESYRMKYQSTMTLREIKKDFEEYINLGTDVPVTVHLDKPHKPKPRKPKPRQVVSEIVADWKARFKRAKAARFKTYADEVAIRIYGPRLKAKPDKWRVGYGVGYKVFAGGRRVQINRGFRIVDTSPDDLMVLVRQVAETGITVTGGYDVLEDRWVPMGDLVRDRKYDA